MKNASAKRTFNLYVDTSDSPSAEFYFPAARKVVKKGLSIDIADSFAEPCSPVNRFANPPASPSLAHKLSDFHLFTPKSSKAAASLYSTLHQTSFSFNFGMDVEKPAHSRSSTPNREYDDFYRNGSYYDVTMRKCHRRTMEDRVIIGVEISGKANFYGLNRLL